MNNEELMQKTKEDMELRGFSKYSYSNYLNKAKHTIEYYKDIKIRLENVINITKILQNNLCNY